MGQVSGIQLALTPRLLTQLECQIMAGPIWIWLRNEKFWPGMGSTPGINNAGARWKGWINPGQSKQAGAKGESQRDTFRGTPSSPQFHLHSCSTCRALLSAASRVWAPRPDSRLRVSEYGFLRWRPRNSVYRTNCMRAAAPAVTDFTLNKTEVYNYNKNNINKKTWLSSKKV